MSGRNLERLLARLDALGDQVRKDVDQIVCEVERATGITGRATELDLAPLTGPEQMLAELDAITDVCRQLSATVTGDTIMKIAARLERVADHYEAEHRLHEQPQESEHTP
ncbi:hypothetical protein [Gordonia sp. (in: high G+C Gram-positive bacteria)]|uniref:hypothetical protein n=1 Tax=Gordonia sp. (in: high G+C Gram-positive bacteria) TaxID=84139 RepID=UPI001D3885BF|nr:hypothetical protein [Gordonia sp. (in: high G+C Gram-positive bacteria)]MCB1293842.1 hypothetical protein [Gordonia sp. (in: high G+C Gram-positive bacteria)]HMS75086.1 hypothetical protein [Gordonia sp. (in: high G+C Gram-positive bacteria)]HQV17864.1 hypothetical protein [Gordonia sp. (in: high G+C Gram-positive bacteria)]